MQTGLREYLIVDENLRVAMRFFGEATGTGKVSAIPGGLAIWSGIEYGVFNIAMLDSPPEGEHGLAERIADAARYFKGVTGRWSFWLCEDYLDPHQQRRARTTFADFGLRPISHPPGMIASSIAPPQHALPPLRIQAVETPDQQRSFAEITALSFEIPYVIADAVYAQPQAWHGDYRGVVGIVDKRIVAIAAIVETKDAIGIYSLATHPGFRRRGYGEALLRQAVEQVEKRTGPRRIVLQASEAGHALYRRLGFRDVTRFTVYLTK